MVRALIDFMIQEVVECLIPSLDWIVVLKFLVLILVLKLCAQVLGCLLVVILVICFLLI